MLPEPFASTNDTFPTVLPEVGEGRIGRSVSSLQFPTILDHNLRFRFPEWFRAVFE